MKLNIAILAVLGIAGFLLWAYVAETPARGTPEKTVQMINGLPSELRQNEALGFSYRYPEGGAIEKTGFEGFLSGIKMAEAVALPESMFLGTNLAEAVVAFGADASPEALNRCGKTETGETAGGTKSINGILWQAASAMGAGAGNIYETKRYLALHNGACFEIAAVLHSGNIANYEPGKVGEFDRAKFSSILDSIVESFRFAKTGKSIVMGAVLLGPTCPVERADRPCPPKGYQTTIEIVPISDNKISTISLATGDDGSFAAVIEPGVYEFRPKGGSPLPRCSAQNASFEKDEYYWLPLSCDTGIR